MRICLMLVGLAILSCKQEQPPFDSKKIEGRWIITEALRKNRATQTLDGAILSITHDQMTHNFYGSDTTMNITWGSNYMLVDTTHFKIEGYLDSLLILSFNVQKYPFRLTLKKLKENQTEDY